CLSACRADRPAVLGLMTSETGASVGSDILEERITGCSCDAARLVGRDPPAVFLIDTKFRDHARGRLNAWLEMGSWRQFQVGNVRSTGARESSARKRGQQELPHIWPPK